METGCSEGSGPKCRASIVVPWQHLDFYSDNDRHAAAWMRELIKEGHLPEGEVDETDIRELDAKRLDGFRRVHLFAGIGGWAYAFELAGWPDDRVVWSGSCPCQSFSNAGKRKGHGDSRNLWPEMLRLIRECSPPVVFGEQVPGAIGFGWLDGVFADLEEAGYACGAVVLGAHSVGAPHIRQRLFWVANATVNGWRGLQRSGQHGQRTQDGGVGGLGHSDGAENDAAEPRQQMLGAGCDSVLWGRSAIQCRDGKARRIEPSIFPLAHGIPGRVALLRGAGNAIVSQVAAAFIRAFLEAESELT